MSLITELAWGFCWASETQSHSEWCEQFITEVAVGEEGGAEFWKRTVYKVLKLLNFDRGYDTPEKVCFLGVYFVEEQRCDRNN